MALPWRRRGGRAREGANTVVLDPGDPQYEAILSRVRRDAADKLDEAGRREPRLFVKVKDTDAEVYVEGTRGALTLRGLDSKRLRSEESLLGGVFSNLKERARGEKVVSRGEAGLVGETNWRGRDGEASLKRPAKYQQSKVRYADADGVGGGARLTDGETRSRIETAARILRETEREVRGLEAKGRVEARDKPFKDADRVRREAARKVRDALAGGDKEAVRAWLRGEAESGVFAGETDLLDALPTDLKTVVRQTQGARGAANRAQQAHRDARAEARAGEAGGAETRAGRAENERLADAFSKSISTFDDLAENVDGFSTGVVARRMQDGGITIQGLKSGQYTAQQLLRIKGMGPGKIESLRKAGFQIPGAVEEKKKPTGVRRLDLERNPLSVENQRSLFTRTRTVETQGGYERRRVKGRFAQWWEERMEGLARMKDRTLAPFQRSPATKTRQEAYRIAKQRRAERLKARVATSRIPMFWVTLYRFGTGTWTLLALMSLLTVLFVPWGLGQVLGYLLGGAIAFLGNAVYFVFVNGIGMGVNALMLGFQVAGSAFFALTQRLLDYMALGLAGGDNATPGSLAFYSETLTLHNPFAQQDVDLNVLQPLKPEWALFPQQFNPNSLGSVLFDVVGNLLGLGAGLGAASTTSVGSACHDAGKEWYACLPQDAWQRIWNGIMGLIEFTTTKVAGGFHYLADVVRTGNLRLLNGNAIQGLRDVFPGQAPPEA